MSEPFVGEIRMFAGNFAPRGWAFCDGQLLAVSQNDALFSLLGTIYGGDGRTTFGLPEMRGRLPVHAGSGPGLSPRRLGARGGAETVTLTANNMPTHTHTVRASDSNGTETAPTNHYFSRDDEKVYHAPPLSSSVTQLTNTAISSVGGSQSHSNLMPALCVNFIIALFGIYPSRQ